jgi:catechol 2,3-dioxygenase-like lactoylglutathione lyase family enzyme
MIHPQTRIGHVHLKVADLERSLRFYRDPSQYPTDTDGNLAMVSEPLDLKALLALA